MYVIKCATDLDPIQVRTVAHENGITILDMFEVVAVNPAESEGATHE